MVLDSIGSIGGVRLLIGAMVVIYLAWQTYDRVFNDDMDDPSMFVGGDWLLFRASGIAYVGILVIVGGLLLAPWMNAPLALLLAGLFVFWWISEDEERGTA